MSNQTMYSDHLRKSDWEVRPVDISEARMIVEKHHYARGASRTATTVHGLFRRGEWWGAQCYGIAWWIPPTRNAAAAWWPNPDEVLGLSRLVIIPEAPKNAATFLMMNSVKLLPTRWKCLLTYADEWQGHTGTIYKAAGWEYLGLTDAKAVFVVDGRMRAIKSGGHTKTYAEMAAMGAVLVGKYRKHRFRFIRSK